MNSVEKILVFRSAAGWIVEKAIDDLKTIEPAPQIDVYSPKAYSDEMRQNSDIHEVIDTGWDGFFKKKSITKALVSDLQARQYDRVVVVYSDIHGDNYDALRALAFKIKGKQVHSFNCRLTWTKLESQGFLMRYVLPRKWFYNVMVVVFCVEIIATTVWDRTLFMLKRPFRKQKGIKS